MGLSLCINRCLRDVKIGDCFSYKRKAYTGEIGTIRELCKFHLGGQVCIFGSNFQCDLGILQLSKVYFDRKENGMNFITVILLGIGLSMDAFAVSVCKGLAMKKLQFRSCILVGLWFGGFQGLMPFVGYLLGINFQQYIETIAPWIACILLVIIGGNMIKESFGEEEEEESANLHVRDMFILAIATSIDALAVGITFVCQPVTMLAKADQFVNTLAACGIIAVTTFLLSICGVKIGNVFGTRYKQKAEITGGGILILLGLKILLEAYGILA